MLPPKLYLVVLSSEPGELDKHDLFGLQKTFRIASRKCFFLSTTCSYPLGEVVIKCSSMVVSVKDLVSWTHLSIRSAQSVFSLGYYWLLNK